METLLEAIDRLRLRGYALDLSAAPDAQLRCAECDELFDAATVHVDETVRFEGDSNPDDESVLVAVSGTCGHLGLYTAAYGPATPPDDVAVLVALARRS